MYIKKNVKNIRLYITIPFFSIKKSIKDGILLIDNLLESCVIIKNSRAAQLKDRVLFYYLCCVL